MNKRFYVNVPWADAAYISDNLEYRKIPYTNWVISLTRVIIEINEEDVPRAAVPGYTWREKTQ